MAKSNDDSECLDCDYHSWMGMPCFHKIKSAIKYGQQFTIEDFHCQWRVKGKDLVCFFELII